MYRTSATSVFAFLAAATFATVAAAQAPSGSSGECKDGTYSAASSKRGACAGHGGVKDWYGAKKADAAAAGAARSPATEPTAKRAAEPSGPASGTAMAGGGAGKVWANTSSKVYHCEKDKWYGKTKKGEYLSEDEAKAKGYHADHGKACT